MYDVLFIGRRKALFAKEIMVSDPLDWVTLLLTDGIEIRKSRQLGLEI